MKKYNILGMMSGTSLDGLDIAHCELWQENGQWNYSIHQATTIGYSEKLKERLKNAIHLSEKEHEQLHLDYGKWLGEQAKDFISKHGLKIDFIASHGHTSHHRPDEGITFQLGEGQELANASVQQVINNFRTLDVKLGGQGAPLVPIGDELLFGEYDFCLNLGGISNISFKKDEKRIAYDIGMANMPLNHITQKIGLEYDENGKLAASGKLIPSLLEALNTLDYYQLPYPKSTGYEWFTEKVLPLIEHSDASPEDLLHTLIVHNCEQISVELKKNSANTDTTILVCGGGAFNDFFIQTLEEKLNGQCKVVVPNKKLINFKEALVFCLMGVLKNEGEINVLKSVTGATQDSCSGEIFYTKVTDNEL
ncbi:anhydro-N-acetylmuramic acid kinase [Allomuricauda sp. d1]|uniref:anhydro-N-acetylmuramic acid kinase n=1 Tax=Allomuricauda sp. d1 TaxID=3136725 RepID=UPI0031D4C84B